MARTGGSKSGSSAPKIGKKRVAFAVHAPHAREVAVAGTFNDWDTSTRPLKRRRRQLEGHLLSRTREYEYRCVVDGIWTDDPCCTTRCWNQ